MIKLSENETQIFDKIFKRIITLSDVAVINFINALFGKNFPLDSQVTHYATENVNGELKKTQSDSMLNINGSETFHIEVEINPNNQDMVLRIFEYGFMHAMKNKEIGKDKIKLKFPEPRVIYLEHSSSTPDKITLELDFPHQDSHEYKVPTMKFLKYSIEELNQQNMVILLPLYLLKLRKEIDKNPTEENAKILEELINEGIIKSIDENCKVGNITPEDAKVLINLLKKLYDYLYENVEILKEKEVAHMLAERLILEVEVAKEIGEEIGEARGEARGKALEKEDVARELLDMGMDIEQIMRATKLPYNSIQNLQMRASV